MGLRPEHGGETERIPLAEQLRIRAVAMLGIEPDFVVSTQQWEELEKLCKTADPLIEKAKKGALGRRVIQKFSNATAEFATAALARAFAHPENAEGYMVAGGFGVWAGMKVLGLHEGNTQQRLDEQALKGVIADMHASPELTENTDWWRVFQSEWQPKIMAMASANRSLNNQPPEMLAWLTLQSANLVHMFPDLTPTVTASWGMGVAQIFGSAKMFKYAEGKFVQAASELTERLGRHGDVTEDEEKKADRARALAVLSTDIINFVSFVVPMLPTIQAFMGKRMDQAAATLAEQLSSAQMSSGPLREKLSAAIGSSIDLASARMGRKFLDQVIEYWKDAKIRVSTEHDLTTTREGLGLRPENGEIVVPPEGKWVVLHGFQPKRLDGSPIGVARDAMIPAGKVIVIRGESGSGKSSLLESMWMRVKGIQGWVGVGDTTGIQWIGDQRTIPERDRMALYINPAREGGSSFIDKALTEYLQQTIFKEAGISVDSSFMRANWQTKVRMAEGNPELHRAVSVLQSYVETYVQKTGLFTENEPCEEMLYRTLGEYSEGQRRRLALALAGIGPHVLVGLDEPTASLDVEKNGEGIASADRVIRYIKWLQEEQGKVVVCVIHDEMKGLLKRFGSHLGAVIEVEKQGGWDITREAPSVALEDPQRVYKERWNELSPLVEDMTHELVQRYVGSETISYKLRNHSTVRRMRVEQEWPKIEEVLQDFLQLGEMHELKWETSDWEQRQWRNLAIATFSHFDRLLSQERTDEAFQLARTSWEMAKVIPAGAELEYGAWLGVSESMLTLIKNKIGPSDEIRKLRKDIWDMKVQRPDFKGRLFEAGWDQKEKNYVQAQLGDPEWDTLAKTAGISRGEAILLFRKPTIAIDSFTRRELAESIVEENRKMFAEADLFLTENEWQMFLDAAYLSSQGFTIPEALLEIRRRENPELKSTAFVYRKMREWAETGALGTNTNIYRLVGETSEAKQMPIDLVWAMQELRNG